MGFKFSAKSLQNLEGVHPKLILVVRKALDFNIMDFKVSSGVRTIQQQKALYAQGRTTPGVNARPGKPLGDPVTWTLESRHLINPDGYGHAVDLDPVPIDYKDISRYYLLATLIFRAAMEEEIQIRWLPHEGVDDFGHYELI